MQLIDEIIEMASGNDTPLPTILRKCLVLAARLKADELRAWASGELQGFDRKNTPPHRIMKITAKGLFLGPFNASISDQPLPASALKPEHREWAHTAHLGQGIAAYEALISGDPKGNAMIHWPADLVVLYQAKFIDGYGLNRAWQELPMPAIAAMLDGIKTKVLVFALELKDQYSDLAETVERSPALAAPTVNQIFYNVFHGGSPVVGNTVQGDMNSSNQQIIIEGDFQSLSAALAHTGVSATMIDDLAKDIDADKRDGAPKGFGTRVAAWVGNAASYIAKESGKAGVEIAKQIISAHISQYFGLPPAGA